MSRKTGTPAWSSATFGSPSMPIQLPLQVKLQRILLGNWDKAAMTLFDRRPFCPQEWVDPNYLVSAQLLDLGSPIVPAQRIIELMELFGHCPHKKLRVTESTRFPPKRIDPLLSPA